MPSQRLLPLKVLVCSAAQLGASVCPLGAAIGKAKKVCKAGRHGAEQSLSVEPRFSLGERGSVSNTKGDRESISHPSSLWEDSAEPSLLFAPKRVLLTRGPKDKRVHFNYLKSTDSR